MVGSRESRCDDAEPCSTGPSRGPYGDDPATRLFRAPLARLASPLLVRSPPAAGLVLVAQPVLAAIAGYAIAFPDRRHVVAGALCFELRATLGVFSRVADAAQGRVATTRERGDACVGNVLAAALFYAGIFWHFRLFAPPAGAWSPYVSPGGVVFLALVCAAARAWIVERWSAGHGPDAEHAEPAPHPSDAGADSVRGRPRAGLLMRASGGGAFLTVVTLAMLTDHLWESQLFFAAVGVPWLLLVAALGARFASGAPLADRVADRARR